MASSKIDFKRELRDLYLPGPSPSLVEVPEMAFLMIDGRGDPNTDPSYRDAIEALYAVAFAAKFTVRRTPPGTDFGVMPLEGLWWSSIPDAFISGDTSDWNWTAMIMQPEPVTAEIVEQARRQAAARKSLPALELMRYERFGEGTAAQLMYVGPYADEGPTIEALHAFIAEHGDDLVGKHHEIHNTTEPSTGHSPRAAARRAACQAQPPRG